MTTNLAEIIPGHAQRAPDRVLVSRRAGAVWQPITALALHEQVTALALGFLAAGVAPGDRVALMAKTRYEWTLVDAALWAVAAVTVPVYETSSAEQLRWSLADSGAVGAVVEGRGHAVMLDTVGNDLPGLRHHWTIDEVEGRPTLQALEAAGSGARLARSPRRARAAARGPDAGQPRDGDLHLRDHGPAERL